MKTRTLVMLAALLAAGLLFAAAPRATAADHFAFSLNFGSRPCLAPAIARRWVEGHYETRVETVLVAPGHYEREWVHPLYATRYTASGRPYTVLVREGYYREVWAPARYETRATRVWAPGCWQEVPVAPRPGRPSFGFYFGF